MDKYIKAFRESCRKLEEDDGNPSLLQAIDYDVDNHEMQHDEKFSELGKKIFKVYEIADDLLDVYKGNKKLEKIRSLLFDAWSYLYEERTKDLDRNHVVTYEDDWYYNPQNHDYGESCEKLEEITAATKNFRGDMENNRQGWGKSNLISDANEIFASIEHFLAEYDTMANSREYNTNSQAARVYKKIEKMQDIIPDTYGADAYNSDMGNKDLVDPVYDNEGDVITAKWRY